MEGWSLEVRICDSDIMLMQYHRMNIINNYRDSIAIHLIKAQVVTYNVIIYYYYMAYTQPQLHVLVDMSEYLSSIEGNGIHMSRKQLL